MADQDLTAFKRCSCCMDLKPRTEFYRAAACKDGLRGECKACVSAKQKIYNAEHAAQIAEQKLIRYNEADAVSRSKKNASYYQLNSEAIKKRAKDWAEANRGAYLKRQAAYWQANRAKLLEKKAQYKSENAELIKQIRSEWYARNKARLKPQRKLLKAHRRNAGRLSSGLVQRLSEMQKARCACCRISLSAGYHLDHITPLARGGMNDDHNMQLLCPTCNLTKSAKDPIDFMQSRGFLL